MGLARTVGTAVVQLQRKHHAAALPRRLRSGRGGRNCRGGFTEGAGGSFAGRFIDSSVHKLGLGLGLGLGGWVGSLCFPDGFPECFLGGSLGFLLSQDLLDGSGHSALLFALRNVQKRIHHIGEIESQRLPRPISIAKHQRGCEEALLHPRSHCAIRIGPLLKALRINKCPHLLFFIVILINQIILILIHSIVHLIIHSIIHSIVHSIIHFFPPRSHQCIHFLFIQLHAAGFARLLRHHPRIQTLRYVEHRTSETPTRFPAIPTKPPATALAKLLSLGYRLRMQQRRLQRRLSSGRRGSSRTGGMVAGRYDVGGDVTLRTTLEGTFPSEGELREKERENGTSSSVRGVWKKGVSGVGLIL